MSNLGTYQTIVVLAKKVGGPRALGAIVAVGGGLLLRGAEAGGKAVWRRARARDRSRGVGLQERPGQFTVTTDADCGSSLTLHAGDKIRVLARDGDTVLIEVVGDANNPYAVSAEILTRISDFDNTPPADPPEPH